LNDKSNYRRFEREIDYLVSTILGYDNYANIYELSMTINGVKVMSKIKGLSMLVKAKVLKSEDYMRSLPDKFVNSIIITLSGQFQTRSRALKISNGLPCKIKDFFCHKDDFEISGSGSESGSGDDQGSGIIPEEGSGAPVDETTSSYASIVTAESLNCTSQIASAFESCSVEYKSCAAESSPVALTLNIEVFEQTSYSQKLENLLYALIGTELELESLEIYFNYNLVYNGTLSAELAETLVEELKSSSSDGVDVTKLVSLNDENMSSEESNEAQTDSTAYYFYQYRKRRSVDRENKLVIFVPDDELNENMLEEIGQVANVLIEDETNRNLIVKYF
jgi:hypothetical protein